MTHWLTVKLKSEIDSHDGKVSEINFKEPKAKSVRKIGMPFTMSGNGDSQTINLDFEKLSLYFEECTGIDDILLEQIGAGDYMRMGTDFVAKLSETMGETPAG